MEDIEMLLGLEIVDVRVKITDMKQYAHERWDERKAKYDILENKDEK